MKERETIPMRLTKDIDDTPLVIATMEAVRQMIAEKYEAKKGMSLPDGWKLCVVAGDKTTVTVGNKEFR